MERGGGSAGVEPPGKVDAVRTATGTVPAEEAAVRLPRAAAAAGHGEQVSTMPAETATTTPSPGKEDAVGPGGLASRDRHVLETRTGPAAAGGAARAGTDTATAGGSQEGVAEARRVSEPDESGRLRPKDALRRAINKTMRSVVKPTLASVTAQAVAEAGRLVDEAEIEELLREEVVFAVDKTKPPLVRSGSEIARTRERAAGGGLLAQFGAGARAGKRADLAGGDDRDDAFAQSSGDAQGNDKGVEDTHSHRAVSDSAAPAIQGAQTSGGPTQSRQVPARPAAESVTTSADGSGAAHTSNRGKKGARGSDGAHTSQQLGLLEGEAQQEALVLNDQKSRATRYGEMAAEVLRRRHPGVLIALQAKGVEVGELARTFEQIVRKRRKRRRRRRHRKARKPSKHRLPSIVPATRNHTELPRATRAVEPADVTQRPPLPRNRKLQKANPRQEHMPRPPPAAAHKRRSSVVDPLSKEAFNRRMLLRRQRLRRGRVDAGRAGCANTAQPRGGDDLLESPAGFDIRRRSEEAPTPLRPPAELSEEATTPEAPAVSLPSETMSAGLVDAAGDTVEGALTTLKEFLSQMDEIEDRDGVALSDDHRSDGLESSSSDEDEDDAQLLRLLGTPAVLRRDASASLATPQTPDFRGRSLAGKQQTDSSGKRGPHGLVFEAGGYFDPPKRPSDDVKRNEDGFSFRHGFGLTSAGRPMDLSPKRIDTATLVRLTRPRDETHQQNADRTAASDLFRGKPRQDVRFSLASPREATPDPLTARSQILGDQREEWFRRFHEVNTGGDIPRPQSKRQAILSRNEELGLAPDPTGVLLVDKATLDLTDRGVGDKRALSISESVRLGDRIRTLKLRNNRLTHVGVAAILDSVNYRNLRFVDLAKNTLGKPGITAVCRLLDEAPMLEHLSLADCSIGDTGTKQVCDALIASTSDSLTRLVLRGCNIGHKGGQAIGELLAVQQTGKKVQPVAHGRGARREAARHEPARTTPRKVVAAASDVNNPQEGGFAAAVQAVAGKQLMRSRRSPRIARFAAGRRELRSSTARRRKQSRVRLESNVDSDSEDDSQQAFMHGGLLELDVSWNHLRGDAAVPFLRGLCKNRKLISLDMSFNASTLWDRRRWWRSSHER